MTDAGKIAAGLTDAPLIEDGYECKECWDSGFVETYSGGIWTGAHITRTLRYCHCLCGADARRQDERLAVRACLEQQP